ncbi:MAG: NnrS family protein, partial [Gammaproteobacteria bacterium]|nr:NnrS family protein [Gammaproteobacteria bacterium]
MTTDMVQQQVALRLRVILSLAFRPFFLLGAVFAVVSVLLWLALLHGVGGQLPATDPVLWHAHEMLFGFAGAAIAGFLLTAVATWTGRPPVTGSTLGTLVVAWVAGRVVMAVGQGWPDLAVAIADLTFPVLLAGLAMREIVAGGSRR